MKTFDKKERSSHGYNHGRDRMKDKSQNQRVFMRRRLHARENFFLTEKDFCLLLFVPQNES